MKSVRCIPAVSVALLGLLLSGCGQSSMRELEIYAQEVTARPGSGIATLPEFKQTPVYIYLSGTQEDAKSPFILFYEERPLAQAGVETVQLNPEWAHEIGEDRNRQELEIFELDSLRMVGSLEQEGKQWGIILDPDRIIHRVEVGNYMGKNIGKIISLNESELELRELVQDGAGRLEERVVTMSLVPEEG